MKHFMFDRNADASLFVDLFGPTAAACTATEAPTRRSTGSVSHNNRCARLAMAPLPHRVG